MQHCRFLPTCLSESSICIWISHHFANLSHLCQNKWWLNRLNWTGKFPWPLNHARSVRAHPRHISRSGQGSKTRQVSSSPNSPTVHNAKMEEDADTLIVRKRYSCRTLPHLSMQSSILSRAAACFNKSCMSGPVVSTSHVSELHRLSLASAE